MQKEALRLPLLPPPGACSCTAPSLLSLRGQKGTRNASVRNALALTHSQCSDPVLPCQFCPALLDLEKKNLKTLGKARGWVCTLKNRSQICLRTLKVRTFIGVVAFSVDFPSWRVPRSSAHPQSSFIRCSVDLLWSMGCVEIPS